MFREYIAVNSNWDEKRYQRKEIEEEQSNTGDGVVSSPMDGMIDVDSERQKKKLLDKGEEDPLLSRQGFKYVRRNPIPKCFIRRNTISTSLERTSSAAGLHENIASANLRMGPFRKELHKVLGIKADLTASTTTGSRILGENSDAQSVMLLPYVSTTVTTRQLIPVRFPNSLNRNIILALQHTFMSSTRNLPKHEANAAGFAARVRGFSSASNGPIGSFMLGSTEVRIPLKMPFLKEYSEQDGSFVIFGDYMSSNGNFLSPQRQTFLGALKRSSVGIGVRKVIQGVPIKYDLSLTSDGNVGAFFSLGRDWNV